jgi:hypothetical protein
MKHGHLAIFIRHDFAEIWGFWYGLILGIGTLKIMARTGVFVRVVCALKRFFSSFPSASSMILVFLTCKQDLSSKFFNLDIENPLGGAAFAKIESSLFFVCFI